MAAERTMATDIRSVLSVERILAVAGPVVIVLHELRNESTHDVVQIRTGQLIENRVNVVAHEVVGHAIIGTEVVVVSEDLVDDFCHGLDGNALQGGVKRALVIFIARAGSVAKILFARSTA